MLSVVMTTTRTLLRNKVPSCRAGLGKKFLLSSAKNTWMEGRALSSLGTMVTDQFTKKHCCTSLILIKRKRNLSPKRRLNKRLLKRSPNRFACVHVPCEILKKSIFSGTSIYSATDDFAHFLEQTDRLVFPNLGTENQNVTNSVIVIV